MSIQAASFDAFLKERYSDSLWEQAAENMAAYVTAEPPRAKAKMTKPGVMALYCPHCGAPLTFDGAPRLHTCVYCKTTLLLPKL
jgi:hypothetical protein